MTSKPDIKTDPGLSPDHNSDTAEVLDYVCDLIGDLSKLLIKTKRPELAHDLTYIAQKISDSKRSLPQP